MPKQELAQKILEMIGQCGQEAATVDQRKKRYTELIEKIEELCQTQEPPQKHDGNLGIGDYVTYHTYPGPTMVKIKCEIGELFPSQALSLRDWLLQETPELERLAKDEEVEDA